MIVVLTLGAALCFGFIAFRQTVLQKRLSVDHWINRRTLSPVDPDPDRYLRLARAAGLVNVLFFGGLLALVAKASGGSERVRILAVGVPALIVVGVAYFTVVQRKYRRFARRSIGEVGDL